MGHISGSFWDPLPFLVGSVLLCWNLLNLRFDLGFCRILWGSNISLKDLYQRSVGILWDAWDFFGSFAVFFWCVRFCSVETCLTCGLIWDSAGFFEVQVAVWRISIKDPSGFCEMLKIFKRDCCRIFRLIIKLNGKVFLFQFRGISFLNKLMPKFSVGSIQESFRILKDSFCICRSIIWNCLLKFPCFSSVEFIESINAKTLIQFRIDSGFMQDWIGVCQCIIRFEFQSGFFQGLFSVDSFATTIKRDQEMKEGKMKGSR